MSRLVFSDGCCRITTDGADPSAAIAVAVDGELDDLVVVELSRLLDEVTLLERPVRLDLAEVTFASVRAVLVGRELPAIVSVEAPSRSVLRTAKLVDAVDGLPLP